jgi:hypothetical protein
LEGFEESESVDEGMDKSEGEEEEFWHMFGG